VYVGALTLDVLLGDVRSLKQKRSAVRPLIADVNRKFPGLAVAETGYQDLHKGAEVKEKQINNKKKKELYKKEL